MRSHSPNPGPPAAPRDPFKDDRQKLSYALGLDFGATLRLRSVQLDPDVYLQGLQDGLAGRETIFTQAEARLAERNLLGKHQTASLMRRGDKNKREEKEFFKANKDKAGVVMLNTGLQYRALKTGDGKKPTADDTVFCRYRGTLIDGTIFDNTLNRDKPVALPLKSVIKGWSEALQLMPVGSKWQIFVPANLAYGEEGAPRAHIGPNAALTFELELVAIREHAAGTTNGNLEVSGARK